MNFIRFQWLLGLLCFASVFACPALAQENPTQFRMVDVYVDSGDKPLAAYQVEFVAESGDVKIAGIEGGEAEPFREPPFYDPKAMQRDRAVLAAFTTAPANQLPKGKIRVATIHVQITGREKPEFAVKLVTAGTSKGQKIKAEASLAERKPK